MAACLDARAIAVSVHMNVAVQRTEMCAVARDLERAEILERRLARFHPCHRARVRALAAQHSRLKDLAESFPALLFTLASPRVDLDPSVAIAQVIAGMRLRDIAATAKLPMWLRSFAPESLAESIPVLPDSDLFRRRIGNLVPISRKDVSLWLRAVSIASCWGDDAIALWAAREWTCRPKSKVRCEDVLAALTRISLWAWHSKHSNPDHPCYPVTRWTPCMTWKSASAARWEWWNSVRLYMSLGEAPLQSVWFQPMTIDGYDFVPLSNASEIVREGQVLQNCVRTYGDRLAHNWCRVWSMRRGGEPYAMLELSFTRLDPLPNIMQLLLAKNAPAPLEAWLVARRWLGAQDLRAAAKQRIPWRQAPLDKRAWQALWKPYWLTKKRIPKGLPLTPTWYALREM